MSNVHWKVISSFLQRLEGISFLLQSVKNFIHGLLYLYMFVTKCSVSKGRECGKNALPLIMLSVHFSAHLLLNIFKHLALLPDSMICILALSGSYLLHCFLLFFLPSFPWLPSLYLFQPNTLKTKPVEFSSNIRSSVKPPPFSPKVEVELFLLNLSGTLSVVPLLQASTICLTEFLCISHLPYLKNGL